MRKFLLVVVLLFGFSFVSAQETYQINNEEIVLIKEVEGTLSLLWNIIDDEYRYFVEKDGEIVELLNTKKDGKFQEQYKKTLAIFTANSDVNTDNVKLILYSLRDFVNRYNQAVDPDYVYNKTTATIQTNLGVFGGVTNNIYTSNPDNEFTPVLGVELEIVDPNLALRHSIFFQLRHSSATSDFDYMSTQLSLNHRFKFVNTGDFNLHLDTELVNFYHSEENMDVLDENGEITSEKNSGFSLKTPLSFGIGMDVRILSNGFLTFSYNDAVSLIMDNNGNFPMDFTVGYKMSL